MQAALLDRERLSVCQRQRDAVQDLDGVIGACPGCPVRPAVLLVRLRWPGRGLFLPAFFGILMDDLFPAVGSIFLQEALQVGRMATVVHEVGRFDLIVGSGC